MLAPEDADRFCAELETDLLAIVDDVTGERLVRRIVRTRELYAGDRIDSLPDLLVEWNDPIARGTTALGGGAGAHVRARSPKIGIIEGMNDYARSGEHRPGGWFVATGPGARRRTNGARGIAARPRADVYANAGGRVTGGGRCADRASRSLSPLAGGGTLIAPRLQCACAHSGAHAMNISLFALRNEPISPSLDVAARKHDMSGLISRGNPSQIARMMYGCRSSRMDQMRACTSRVPHEPLRGRRRAWRRSPLAPGTDRADRSERQRASRRDSCTKACSPSQWRRAEVNGAPKRAPGRRTTSPRSRSRADSCRYRGLCCARRLAPRCTYRCTTLSPRRCGCTGSVRTAATLTPCKWRPARHETIHFLATLLASSTTPRAPRPIPPATHPPRIRS